MITRFRRWWNRTFGDNSYDDLVDMSNVHEHLVATLKEWDENFHPDKQ